MKKDIKVTSGFKFSLVSEKIVGVSSSLDKAINFVSRFVITLVLSFGAVFTFNSMMNMKVAGGVLLLILACSSLVSTIGYNSKFKNLYVFLSSVLAVLIGVVFAFETVKNGTTVVYESTVKSIYESMYWTVPDMSIKHLSSHTFEATYFMSLVSILLTFAVGYFVTARINFIGVFLLTFPFFEIGAAFGCVSDKIPFACLLAGWGAALVLHISLRQRNVTKLQNIQNTKKQKAYTYTDSTKRFGASALVMVLALLLVFSTVNSALISAGFSRSSKLDNFRKDFKEAVLNAYDLITGFDHDASLKEGDLAVLADRKVKNRKYAVLETNDLENDLYFRGYVGGVYTGYSWEPIQQDEYEFIEEFREYLNKKDITLPSLTGDLVDTDANGNILRPSDFKLYDFRRQKNYMYIANGTTLGPGMDSEYDTYLTTDDTSDYDYQAYTDPTAPFIVSGTSRFNTDNFQKYWKTYVDFVNYEYLMLPQEGMEEIKNLGEILRGSSIYESVDNVRNFVAENAEYSDFVASLPDGKDFASYFLFDKGVGYSAHYATACAVILRAMGIPTRYVEGFIVSNEQVLKGENTGNARKVELTDGNSHAWIEVFLEDSGWVPLETTEGFYSKSFADQFNDSQNEEDDEDDKIESPVVEQPEDQPDQEEYVPDTEDAEDAEESDEHKYQKLSVVETLTLIFLIVLGLFVATVVTFVVRRIIVLTKRNKIFDSSDYKLQINEGFKLLKKILKFSGVNICELYSYDMLAKIICESFEHVDYTQAKQMITIYEKTQFSREIPREQDATKFLDFVDDLGDKVYQKLVVKDRLKFKFIDMI